MTTITLTAGTILHFYIEKPFIAIGKKIEISISSKNYNKLESV